MHHFLKIFASLLLVLAASFAEANDLIIERAYWVDPTGQADLSQVTQQDFTPFERVLSLGYTRSVTWIRLKVEQPEGAYRAILRVRPNYLDDLQLFSSQDQTALSLHLYAGDRYTKEQSNYLGKDHGFWVWPTQKGSEYYLRVATTSTSVIYPQVLIAADMKESEAFENLAFGFYLGLMCWILLWAMTTYSYRPEAILLGFTVYQLVSILLALSFMGYLGGYLLPKGMASDWITSNLVLGASVVAYFFHYNFLIQYPIPKIYRKILVLLFGFAVINWMAGNFVDVFWSLRANAYFVLLGTSFLTIVVVQNYWNSKKRQIIVLAVYLLLLFVMMISQSISVGLFAPIELTINVALLHGLLAGILIYYMMYDRSQRLEKEHINEQTQALLMTKKLESEINLREAQSAFVALLIHELKSPLAVIKLSLASIAKKLGEAILPAQSNLERLNTAADDMNALIERCVEVQKIEQGAIPVYKKRMNLSAVIDSIVHMKDVEQRVVRRVPSNIEIVGDEDLIKIVLMNLLENAYKYSSRSTPVEIDVKVDSEKVIIQYSNQVDPLAMPEVGQIFEKFYRSEEAKRHRGSGLGLWLSRQMAELMGGTLQYHPGNNVVTFEFVIPV